jgi:hypothetical protein
MVLQLLQLFEGDGERVVHEVLPQLAKSLVPEDPRSLLEVVLGNVPVVGDASLEDVIFDEIMLLVLRLGDGDVVVREERVIVGTKVGEHLEAKPFLGKVEGARHESGLRIAHGADVLQFYIIK